MKAAAVAAIFLLSACGDDSVSRNELSAREAIQAGDIELAKAIPQWKHHMMDVKAELRAETWHLHYGGGTGGAKVDVNSRTGKATVINIQQ